MGVCLHMMPDTSCAATAVQQHNLLTKACCTHLHLWSASALDMWLMSMPPYCTLLLQALVSNNVSLSLSAAVALAAAQQPLSVTHQQQDAVLDFVGRRLEQLLSDAGVSAEAGGPLLRAVASHGFA